MPVDRSRRTSCAKGIYTLGEQSSSGEQISGDMAHSKEGF